MADEGEISWSYDDGSPCLGIRLKTYNGSEYPSESPEEILVFIDTGYDGEICIPWRIYAELGFERWEEPESKEYETADKRVISMKVANGCILIPKHSPVIIPVKVETPTEEEHTDEEEIIIGAKFIKRFRLLLDGPAEKACLL